MAPNTQDPGWNPEYKIGDPVFRWDPRLETLDETRDTKPIVVSLGDTRNPEIKLLIFGWDPRPNSLDNSWVRDLPFSKT